jgi:hypothetical protein
VSDADDVPLLTLTESWLSMWTEGRKREVLKVFEERVELKRERTRGVGLKRDDTVTVPYEQITRVVVRRGLFWSALVVDEAMGGHGFVIGGLNKDAADAAKAAIDERVGRAGRSSM